MKGQIILMEPLWGMEVFLPNNIQEKFTPAISLITFYPFPKRLMQFFEIHFHLQKSYNQGLGHP